MKYKTVEEQTAYLQGYNQAEKDAEHLAKWIEWKKRKAIFLDNADEQYKELGYPHRNILLLVCSRCRMVTAVDESIFYNFCPHCGAKIER